MSEAFKVVCSNLLEEDGRFLLVKEGKRPVRGEWNLPAGTLEAGESPVEAAKRECREETGLEVSPKGLLGIYIAERKGERDVVNFVFRSEIESGELSVPEEDTVIDNGWFSREELGELELRASYIVEAVKDSRNGETSGLELFRMF